MQEEKDYVQREVKRLTLFLTKLIGKALGVSATEFEDKIQDIESELKNEFNLTLREISELSDTDLIDKINGLDEQHLEKLAELINSIASNLKDEFRYRLVKKGILILELLDRNSKIFSLKRMELKKTLQQYLP